MTTDTAPLTDATTTDDLLPVRVHPAEALLAQVRAAGFVFHQWDHEDDGTASAEDPAVLLQDDNALPDTVNLQSASAPSAPRSKAAAAAINVLPEYRLIQDLVKRQFPLILVTGGAGTGKSTLIQWLMRTFRGSTLLGAPTAMAAMNIEGKTLHALCQLPPAWIVKKDIKTLPHRTDIKEAKLLIIDEISMVTANLLDGISAFLRKNRDEGAAFGGMTVIMVGDLFQLPPVVTEATRHLFDQVYGSPQFFHARCLRQAPFYAVELKTTFRQSDQSFIHLLTHIREGLALEDAMAKLNSLCQITSTPPENAVWLSPRNAEVDLCNSQALERLEAEMRSYTGQMSGQFKPDRLPAPKELILKVGAQVMFTKNDPNRRWINGTIGTVRRMDADKVVVALAGNKQVVQVEREEWFEYQYRWDEIEEAIDRDETGRYVQFPLVLAWAMTIHKSQGRTLDRVHLDLGNGAFETGQTYVALSRCRSIEGLSLTRPLRLSDIQVDGEAKAFYRHLRHLIRRLPPETMIEQLAASPAVATPVNDAPAPLTALPAGDSALD